MPRARGQESIFAIVPARNEAARLRDVLSRMPEQVGGIPLRVLVVDDGSSDATAAVAAESAHRAVSHAINLGKGAALRTGCEVAVSAGARALVLLDADGQHRPEDLPRILEPVLAGAADLAISYRRFGGSMPPTMRAGNVLLSGLFWLLFGRSFRDTQCGFRAMTAEAYEKLAWKSSGYAVETEMLVRAARAGLRVAELPIETVYLDRRKGTTIADGARIFADMLRWRVLRG